MTPIPDSLRPLLERVAKPVETQYDRDQRWTALEELRALLAQPAEQVPPLIQCLRQHGQQIAERAFDAQEAKYPQPQPSAAQTVEVVIEGLGECQLEMVGGKVFMPAVTVSDIARMAVGKPSAAQSAPDEREAVEITREHLAGLQVFANDMISAALGGGDVDGATIQEQAVKHGLLARKIMTGPCCGPDDGYCSCAYHTSFPTECFRKTVALVAELPQAGTTWQRPQSAPAGAELEIKQHVRDALLMWNRRHDGPPIKVGYEYGVADAVMYLLAAAPQPAAKCATCSSVGIVGHSELCPECNGATQPAARQEPVVHACAGCVSCKGRPGSNNNPCHVCGGTVSAAHDQSEVRRLREVLREVVGYYKGMPTGLLMRINAALSASAEGK